MRRPCRRPLPAATAAPAATGRPYGARARGRRKGAARVLRRRGVRVVAACPVEPCTATAKGRIVIRGSSKRFQLRPATKQIAQGAKATLELTLRKTTLTAIRRALKQGKKVSAKLTVTAKDAYGNPNTEQRTVKLKR